MTAPAWVHKRDGRVVPFGSGATVFHNYVDLRFVNPGPETYRIRLWLTDDELRGELWADRPHPLFRELLAAALVRSEGRLPRLIPIDADVGAAPA